MVSTSASVVELAEDWLTAKRALESAAQAEKGNSDRARRADLERWALVLGEARGRSPTADQPPLASLMLVDLCEEVLLAAMALVPARQIRDVLIDPPGEHASALGVFTVSRCSARGVSSFDIRRR